MTICYGFTRHMTYDDCINEASLVDLPTIAGRDTVSTWYTRCAEMVVGHFLESESERGKIGGPGTVVQIDESKFGKRKYNRGRRVEGYWVLGMIQDGSEDFRLALCPENSRTAEDLIPLIKQHVEIGTEIHTDCWAAYNGLEEAGYIHKTVNHSDPDKRYKFVGPDGTHTNRIESSWRPAKDWYRKYRGRQTCANCRNIRNVLCDVHVELQAECPDCKDAPLVCKKCLAAMRKCHDCHRKRYDCEKCRSFHEDFANKVVVYQWERWCTKHNLDRFDQLLQAIKKYYPQ